MEALHVRTYGMYCNKCTQAVERVLSEIEGVASSIAVKSLEVTSVLYEPLAVARKAIVEAIRSAGFEAELVDDIPASKMTNNIVSVA